VAGLEADDPKPLLSPARVLFEYRINAITAEGKMTKITRLLYHDIVAADWVDYNRHMNVAFYVLVFDRATDNLLDHLEVGASYAKTTGASTFVMESHTFYLREMILGAAIRVETQLIDFDSKKLHYFHLMYHTTKNYLAATHEQMSIHVNLKTRRSSAFPEAVISRLELLRGQHASLGYRKGLVQASQSEHALDEFDEILAGGNGRPQVSVGCGVSGLAIHLCRVYTQLTTRS
jgi:acyl-CoA thioester hydrolase